jgi:hypothetical protein
MFVSFRRVYIRLMHFINHGTLLVSVAAVSLAVLVVMVVFILHADAMATTPKAGAMQHQEASFASVARPAIISRAIGGQNQDNLQHMRSFRAANLLLAGLPTAWAIHRERIAEQRYSASAALIQ